MKILVTGGDGRFAKEIGNYFIDHEMSLLGRKQMDVTDAQAVFREIDRFNPEMVIHTAALLHGSMVELNRANVEGTINVVKACESRSIKVVYISTDGVYGGNDCHKKAIDSPLLPDDLYSESKMEGEIVVGAYSNSLIIRGAFCPNPYPYSDAFVNVFKNAIYQDDAAAVLCEALDRFGTLNVFGSKVISMYEFASQTMLVSKKTANRGMTVQLT